MTAPGRPDRFMTSEKDIPITTPPANPNASVKGRPTKLPRRRREG